MVMKKSALSISVSLHLSGTLGLKPISHNPYLYGGWRLLPDVETTTIYQKPNSVYENVVHAHLTANMIPKENIPRVRIVK